MKLKDAIVLAALISILIGAWLWRQVVLDLVETAEMQVEGQQDIATEKTEPFEPGLDSIDASGNWVGVCPEGGAYSIGALMYEVSKDPVLVRHFSGFDFTRAVVGRFDGTGRVTYREGDKILTGTRKLKFKSDPIVTDGKRVIRMHCCNDIVLDPPVYDTPTAQAPNLSKPSEWIYHAPPIEVMESPLQQWHRPESETGSRQFFHIDKHERHTPTAPVPEPSTMLLLVVGLVALAAWRKR